MFTSAMPPITRGSGEAAVGGALDDAHQRNGGDEGHHADHAAVGGLLLLLDDLKPVGRGLPPCGRRARRPRARRPRGRAGRSARAGVSSSTADGCGVRRGRRRSRRASDRAQTACVAHYRSRGPLGSRAGPTTIRFPATRRSRRFQPWPRGSTSGRHAEQLRSRAAWRAARGRCRGSGRLGGRVRRRGVRSGRSGRSCADREKRQQLRGHFGPSADPVGLGADAALPADSAMREIEV